MYDACCSSKDLVKIIVYERTEGEYKGLTKEILSSCETKKDNN